MRLKSIANAIGFYRKILFEPTEIPIYRKKIANATVFYRKCDNYVSQMYRKCDVFLSQVKESKVI